MTNTVRVRVPAKVNLALRVGGTDPQGFHELGTVFQAVSLGDEVNAELAPAGEFRLAFHGEGAGFLPVDDTNLAIRAARLLARNFDLTDVGVSLVIRKRIPVAGGMAGGSADAAAVLVACNELWQVGATKEQLHAAAAELGSDVPFLLLGGTALGVGRGVQLTILPTAGTYHWAFALSHTGLSTPAVFREFDQISAPQATEVSAGLISALQRGDVAAVGKHLVNDLQSAAISLHPPLAHILKLGISAGALGAIVSGSGPTCAFLSDSEEAATEIAEQLSVFSGVRAVRRAYGPVSGAQVLR